MIFAETEKTELKQKLTETILKEIVAFLNTDGGTVYIGVNDNGSVCGVNNLDESLKKIADILEMQILPDPRNFVELGTKYIDQKHVIEIKIQKGDSLYYIKKYGRSSQGCFVRMGSTSRSMTEQQITLTHNKYLDSTVKITEIESRITTPTFQYLKLLLTEKGFTINETRTSFRNGERINTPLFDKTAFREVWFNACLHNNWADGTPPAIYIFTDRIEIISTGGLPINLSKEDFFRGVSKPVNEELAKLFIRLDLMEQTGYGIPLVTERYGKSVFEFLDFFLRVTIPFAYEIEGEISQNEPENEGGNKNDTINNTINDTINLSETELLVLNQIKNNRSITREILSINTNLSDSTVARCLKSLQEKNVIIRNGAKKNGHWKIINCN